MSTSAPRRWRIFLYGVAAAGAAGILCTLIALVFQLAGSPVQIQQANGPVTDLPVIAAFVASLLPGILGSAAFALALGRIPRTVLVMQIVAGVITLLSLISPFTLPVDTTSIVVLSVMHLLVGGFVIAGLTIAARTATRSTSAAAPATA